MLGWVRDLDGVSQRDSWGVGKQPIPNDLKIILLQDRSKPHRANLKEDYIVLKNMSINKKKNEAYEIWLDEKMKETYISIDNSFAGCEFNKKGWIKN